MGVTPIEILNKEFDKRFRGYDEEQVNDYLDVVASELDRLSKEHSEMKQQLDAAVDKLRYFEQLQDSLNNSIVVAHEAAERLKQNARKEAELILYEAEREADRLVAEASTQAQQITANNENLRRSGQELHKQLRYMLTTQLEALDGTKDAELLQPVEVSTPMTVAVEPQQPVEPEVSPEAAPDLADETDTTETLEADTSYSEEPTLATDVTFQEVSDTELSFEEVTEFPTMEEEPLEVIHEPVVTDTVEAVVETNDYVAPPKTTLPDYESEERYIPEPTLKEVNTADFTALLEQAVEKDAALNEPTDMESVLGQTIRIDLPK